MSYIEAINQAATAQTQAESKRTDSSGDVLGKEDFLTLLVAQLKNQDPLNPDEPTEFTAQLAQFSSLEQLFNLNDSMNGVSTALADSQKLSALSLIGKEATYFGSSLKFDGSPVKVGYSLDGPATSVKLHLKLDGETIVTLEGDDLTAGNHFLTWDGLNEDGLPAPVGDYTIVIEAVAAEGSIAAAPLIRSEVTGVDLESANGGLLFTKAGQVYVNEVKGVYDLAADSDSDQENTEDAETEIEASIDSTTALVEDASAAVELTENVATEL